MPDTQTMTKVFARPKSLTDKKFTYCPGCHHGLITRILGGAIDKLGIRERTVMVAPVGCAVFAYEWFRCDGIQAAHGRAAAVATGIKRANPDLAVISYQGDGDLAAIGTAETIHAANRGEAITVIFVNNQIYGMTGGQMAPTTLPGQVTTTCPMGRDTDQVGFPIRVAELLATLNTPGYVARVSVHKPRHQVEAKKAIRKAFEYQVAGRCFGLVECLSTCPTNWGQTPVEAAQWLEREMMPYFPLGELKTPE